MQPGDPALHHTLVTPLPSGPNERRRYDADGAAETAMATQLGLESQHDTKATQEEADEEHELYYYVPTHTEDDAWQQATRPNLPLRNNTGDKVTEEEWKAEQIASEACQWTKTISDWASVVSSPDECKSCPCRDMFLSG